MRITLRYANIMNVILLIIIVIIYQCYYSYYLILIIKSRLNGFRSFFTVPILLHFDNNNQYLTMADACAYFLKQKPSGL